jgi:hypothetical protein
MAGLIEFYCGSNETSLGSLFKWLEYTFKVDCAMKNMGGGSNFILMLGLLQLILPSSLQLTTVRSLDWSYVQSP